MNCKVDYNYIKTFVRCEICGVYLCVEKERNCFLNYHKNVQMPKIFKGI